MVLSFLLTCLIIEITPGPNMTYLAIITLSDGKKAGFSAVAGVALGLLVVGIIASIGVAALIVNSTILYQLLRWGGIIYLLWLAWSGWYDDKETSATKLISTDTAITFFTRGLITNLLNPKAFIFYIAILPEFLTVERVFLQSIKLTLIYVLIATCVHSFIILLAARVRIFFDSPTQMQLIRRILSALLVIVAIWLAIETDI